jgi:hypothetical protein
MAAVELHTPEGLPGAVELAVLAGSLAGNGHVVNILVTFTVSCPSRTAVLQEPQQHQ